MLLLIKYFLGYKIKNNVTSVAYVTCEGNERCILEFGMDNSRKESTWKSWERR